jgi:putative DNA primase/helicase
LKGITSGEPSTVEHKYGDPFVMYPFATCWFGTNHLPRTKDYSDALFRRAIIITFNRTFRPSEQDPLLKECLKEELPGILLMALDAYALAQENGFTEPQSSKETKGEWRKEADQVAQFLDERTEHAPQKQEPFQLVYSNYEDWAVNEGIQHKMSKRGFRERLSRLGYGNKRDNKTRYVTDLRVLIPF